MLSDAQWERIAPELSGKAGDPGSSGREHRLSIEAVLWIARTGSPWRDLPEAFGKWFTVYTRFWRWAQKGVWERIFKALCDDPDFEYVLIDGTLVRVHQHGTGAKGGLKISPSAARVAAGPPKSWPWSMPSAISFASSFCLASVTTASVSSL